MLLEVSTGRPETAAPTCRHDEHANNGILNERKREIEARMLNARRITWRFPTADLPWFAAWWVGFSLWHVMAILCCVRRVGGAFLNPLSSVGLLAFAVAICWVSTVWRLTLERPQLGIDQNDRFLLRLAPTLASLLFIGSVTLSGSSLTPIILSWSAIVATETFWLTRIGANWPRNIPEAAKVPSGVEPEERIEAPLMPTSRSDAAGPSALDWDSESLPAGVSQQFLRSQHDEGETWAGLLRIEFPPDETLQIVHVPFYPPFAKNPHVQISQVSGPPVSMKVTQIESFGVRFELKNQPTAAASTPSAAFSVVVELEATATNNDPCDEDLI